MASLTLTITSVADGTLSKTYTISEADMATWFSAIQALYRRPTHVAAALVWADSVMQDQVQTVRIYQQQQLAATVSPITVT